MLIWINSIKVDDRVRWNITDMKVAVISIESTQFYEIEPHILQHTLMKLLTLWLLLLNCQCSITMYVPQWVTFSDSVSRSSNQVFCQLRMGTRGNAGFPKQRWTEERHAREKYSSTKRSQVPWIQISGGGRLGYSQRSVVSVNGLVTACKTVQWKSHSWLCRHWSGSHHQKMFWLLLWWWQWIKFKGSQFLVLWIWLHTPDFN